MSLNGADFIFYVNMNSSKPVAVNVCFDGWETTNTV